MKMFLKLEFVSSILIVYCIKFQYSVVQSPWIQLQKYQSKTGTEVVCSSSQFHIGTYNFYENGTLMVEIWNNGSFCRLQPDMLRSNLKCGCRDEVSTACNITDGPSKTGCQKWRCAATKDSILTFSDFVEVCDHVSTSSTTESSPTTITDVYQIFNCSSTHKVDWIIDHSKYDLFQIKKYYRDNISVLIESFKSEENGSIVLCKVEEPAEKEWAISILYPLGLCDYETFIPIKNMIFNETCQLRHGNPNIKVQVGTVSNCPLITEMSISEIDITLCEAVNRDDLGARKYAGNASGLFKVEILYPASIIKYDITIEDIRSHENLTSDGTRYIRFICNGNSNPPPVMTLIKDETVLWSQSTHLQHKIHLSTNKESGLYTCIASNELGSDNKSIYVNPQSVDARGENIATKDNMFIYVVIGVVALALASLLINLVLRTVSCYRPLRPTDIGSMVVDMVNIETSEQLVPETQATEQDLSRAGSVHFYESIPPSPIADISFSEIAVDNDIDIGWYTF
ncbi:uncharacterized protein LOC127867208 [Dreissena polymorpha]|uniref:uncharacterized protein LOC127867208 n=1 Tax=Dreissena polymorpha TaxID=45954 RepID=UPI0022646FB4|nr:uncharacterized protein LOC127867208 [Dreissena polymorpha]